MPKKFEFKFKNEPFKNVYSCVWKVVFSNKWKQLIANISITDGSADWWWFFPDLCRFFCRFFDSDIGNPPAELINNRIWHRWPGLPKRYIIIQLGEIQNIKVQCSVTRLVMDGLDYGSVSRWVVLHFSRLKKRRKNVKTFSYEVKTEGGMFGSMAAPA